MNMQIKHFFDASHQLTDSEYLTSKACARLHGHTYAVIVEIKDQDLNPAGMVIDFKDIKNLIDELDHRHINDILEVQPTAENIATWIKDKILKEYAFDAKVSICEGYKGMERSSWVTI